MMFVRTWFLAGSLSLFLPLLVNGCRENGSSESEPAQSVDELLEATFERTASATTEIRSRASFFYSIWGQPMLTKLAELPDSGEVTANKRPYSGYWYPESRGGTHVGNPSPLRKYDQAFYGGEAHAVTWEQANHTRPTNDPHANWAGHCNGFSAAATRHREPQTSVVHNGVTFTPADIKALLAEVHMSVKSVFLAGKRCRSTSFNTLPSARPDPTVMDACSDANPASFHIALANWIGRQRHPLVIDIDANFQVSNFPMYKFKSTIEANVSQARALQLINAPAGEYIFNPEAVAFAHVSTTITYATFLESWAAETQGSYPRHVARTRTYSYILELDATGEILGGEWTGQSQSGHPDFVWVALEPVEPTGDPQFGNPLVSHHEVIRLWAQSVGEDPDYPPLSIMEPNWQSSWGKFANFSVKIDGNNQGAVFLGKDTLIEISRNQALHGSVSLDIGLNDRVIASITGKGEDDIRHRIRPGPGINRLAFIWRSNGQEVDKAFLRFHAIP